MKVTLELPEWAHCVSVTAFGLFSAAIGLRYVSDGDTIVVEDPKKKGESDK